MKQEKGTREEHIAYLESELKKICGTPLLIGHRGGNDLQNLLEAATHEDRVNTAAELVEKANALAAEITFAELGLDIQEFQLVSLQASEDSRLHLGTPIVDQRNPQATRVFNTTFHPSDVLVPYYHNEQNFGGNVISPVTQKEGSIFAVYRKIGSVPKPRRDIYSPERKWYQYAKTMYESNVTDPFVWLENMKQIRGKFGDASELQQIEEAVAELHELFAQ